MEINFRPATREDLLEIVRMRADDFLGATREREENPLPENYVKAFEEIEADKNNELIVAEVNGVIVGTLQITFTPSISFQGGKRATVESVRVDEKYLPAGNRQRVDAPGNRTRESGKLSRAAIDDESERKDAHRFYENLGFKGTHLGMKLYLKND